MEVEAANNIACLSQEPSTQLKVLVINPPNAPLTDPALLIEPIDVLTVASFVKSLGAAVKMIDMDVLGLTPYEIEPFVDNFKPDIVVIPFDYHIPLFTKEAAKAVREIASFFANRRIWTIIGGRPSTYYPKEFLGFEYTILINGEMEPALSELLNIPLPYWDTLRLQKISGLVLKHADNVVHTAVRNSRFDMEDLPIPDRSLLDLTRYIDVRTLLSSRGCVEQCSFCPIHTFWGKWRYRAPNQVVDEIEYLVSSHGAKKILFLDDHTTASSKRMRDISQILIDREIKVSLGCLATVASYEHETFALMFQAGFRWVHFGAESGSNRILSTLKKRSSVERTRDVLSCSQSLGFRVRTSWILDPPGGEKEDLEATLNLILETKTPEIRIHYLTLRAGAPLSLAHTNGDIPSQYIHSNKPHSGLDRVAPAYLQSALGEFIQNIKRSGYVVLRDSAEWNNYSAPQLSDPAFRFVSFCPGRYGVGWTL